MMVLDVVRMGLLDTTVEAVHIEGCDSLLGEALNAPPRLRHRFKSWGKGQPTGDAQIGVRVMLTPRSTWDAKSRTAGG